MFKFIKPAKLPPLSDTQISNFHNIWILFGCCQDGYFDTLKSYEGGEAALEELARFIARKKAEYAANPGQHLIDVASITGFADPKQNKTILNLYKISVLSVPISELTF